MVPSPRFPDSWSSNLSFSSESKAKTRSTMIVDNFTQAWEPFEIGGVRAMLWETGYRPCHQTMENPIFSDAYYRWNSHSSSKMYTFAKKYLLRKVSLVVKFWNRACSMRERWTAIVGLNAKVKVRTVSYLNEQQVIDNLTKIHKGNIL